MTLYICNIKDPTSHCNVYCLHGQIHIKDIGADSCLKPEKCIIVNKRVKCRKLYKKEIKQLLANMNISEDIKALAVTKSKKKKVVKKVNKSHPKTPPKALKLPDKHIISEDIKIPKTKSKNAAKGLFKFLN